MCGLVSILSKKLISLDQLKKATRALSHRGPDGEGYWISKDKTVGLGHRRLSILDLEGGKQPLSNQEETLFAVVNGEFYEFETIRQDLIKKGHTFRTSSDSEILIHLYQEYNLDFIHHLRGEFAFVLYDTRKRKLIAARDRFGIKPLCYAQSEDGTFYIASEAKALFNAGFDAKWDEYALYHACHIQYVPCNKTLFEGVSTLPPGHMLILDDHQFKLHAYWDIHYPCAFDETRSDKEWMEQFFQEFNEAVNLRLRADVPICFHLSGGLDSSSVAALAMHLKVHPMDCFTVHFEEDGYDELPIANEMANHLGAKLHVVSVSQDTLIEHLETSVYQSEGLAINGHITGKFLLNKAIHQAGFKVALAGEGADELLAGYPHFREDLMRHEQSDGKHQHTLYENNAKLAGIFLPHGRSLSTKKIEQALNFTPSFLMAKATLGHRMRTILSSDFKNRYGDDIYDEMLHSFDIKGQLQGRHNVNQSTYLWMKLALSTYILRTLGDGCEMASSVEVRLPFLDHKLFEFCRTMPMHLKIKDRTEKYILRQAMKPFITDTIYKRQKHPFIAPPISRYSNKKVNQWIQDTIRSSAFIQLPFFDHQKIVSLLDKLPFLATKDQLAMDPILMMALSSFFLQERYKL